ncbi:MAG: hypothetical protein JWM32_3081 [Verrucomicrobia bacterium]|nr:hypothetical protein [Verrucomicrobiota bacterium]
MAVGAPPSAFATNVALTLMPPDSAVASGSEVTLDLIALNPAPNEIPFMVGASLAGRLATASGSWSVELRATHAAPTSVAAGSFAVCHYIVVIPREASGRAVIEVEVKPGGVAPLRAVLEVEPETTPVRQPSATPLAQLGSSTRAIDAVMNRTFAGRLAPNDPIYFIYGGGKNAAAKFQFSFNYRLATFSWGADGHERALNLQLGYTQRSLWDIDAHSSPFYDTSYMPELSVEALATVPEKSSSWFTWIGVRSGVLHESNGQVGDDSRSLNIFYVRPMFALGPLDSWHLGVGPDFWTYITSLDENKDLKNYRGYGRLRMIFGKTNGPSLLFAGWAGQHFEHVTYQLDLTYPLRTKLLDFESFLLVQYFDGYGESLRAYDKKSQTLRVGLELLR